MSSRGWSAPVLVFALVGLPIGLALLFMVIYSLGATGLLSHGWTTAYWRSIFIDAQTWLSLVYSLYIGVTSLGVSTLLALFLVFALGPRLRGGILGHLIFIPLAIPPIVAALLTAELFGDAGLISRLGFALGWTSSPADFPSIVFSRWGIGIIAAHVMLVTPFLVLLFDRILRNEAVGELLALSRTLGASYRQALQHVAIPVILRAARPALSVYLVVLIGAFEIPLMIGAQSPSMISILIWTRLSQFDLETKPQAFAIAVLFALLMAAGLLILRNPTHGTERDQ